jgi:hypothetical protein
MAHQLSRRWRRYRPGVGRRVGVTTRFPKCATAPGASGATALVGSTVTRSFSFALADSELPGGQVQVLDAQREALEQADPGTVEQPGHEVRPALRAARAAQQRSQHPRDLLGREHLREPLGALRPNDPVGRRHRGAEHRLRTSIVFGAHGPGQDGKMAARQIPTVADYVRWLVQPADQIRGCFARRQNRRDCKSPAPPKWLPGSELPLQGSNLDSSDPESDVLPVTPRGINPSILCRRAGTFPARRAVP